MSAGDSPDSASLPPALVPSEPQAPDRAYEEQEVRDRIRAAIASLPPRERKVIGLYYYGDATMKQIGADIGVNESRVSQLHARAIQRLRKALGADCGNETACAAALLSFQGTMRRLRMAKADLAPRKPGVVLQYRSPAADQTAAPRRRAEGLLAAAR